MKVIHWLICVLFLSLNICAQAQKIFSYGSSHVSKQEFLRAFLKNNTGKHTAKAYRDYLDLYIRFKLKVKAAYDLKMDTLPNQKAELNDFRNQVTETYLIDEPSFKKLVQEAFVRSQKDIHLAHIFIAIDATGNNTAVAGESVTSRASKMTTTVYNELQKGTDFSKLASTYSSDVSSKLNGGDIGYITVFTLPYVLENIVYTIPVGKFSKPYRSRAGYHIFKILGERKAAGKMKAAQLFFAFPPDTIIKPTSIIKQKADSVYRLLSQGISFGQLASSVSDDSNMPATYAEMPEFGVGSFDPRFEERVFALEKNGSFTQPIQTPKGYYIISRLQQTPVNTDPQNDSAMKLLGQIVQNDARMEVARKALLKNADFTAQLKEFKEGNLLFEIMQRNIWDKASADSLGLKSYYEKNKNKYWWNPSADAIIFSLPGEATALELKGRLEKNMAGWRSIIPSYQTNVQADSGRFELSQLPMGQQPPVPGMLTKPLKASEDSSTSFVHIIKLYPGKQPRNFEDAKGFVLNDYQDYLENKWITTLKKKYPVKINEPVFQSLVKTP